MDVGDVLAGRYELLEQVGRGGMGRVLRARDRTLGRDVAVKLLAPHLLGDEEAVAALRDEAQRAAGVRHPNVVQVLDAVLDDTDQPAIVMEYVDGPSLAEVIPPDGMEVEAALEVLRAVGSGLAAVHATGLVHRDVSPGNVLLDAGVPRLTDFGIARAASTTGTTTIRGSLSYLAPELADAAPIGPTADVYALGCLATKLLTGAPPFRAEHPVAMVHKHLNEPAPDVRDRSPDVPPQVAAGIAAALHKDPADRPGSVLELLDVLGLAPSTPAPETSGQRQQPTPAPADGAAATEALTPDQVATRAIGPTAMPADARAPGEQEGQQEEEDDPDGDRHLVPLLLTALAVLLLAWLAVVGLGASTDPTAPASPQPTAPTPTPSPATTPSPSPSPEEEAPAEPSDDSGPPEDRGPDGEGPPGQQDEGPGSGRGGGP